MLPVVSYRLPSLHHQPRMLFIDAAGTLIQPRDRVGEIYSRIAHETGIHLSPDELQHRFGRFIATQPPMAFGPGLAGDALLHSEQAWWKALARDVFGSASDSPKFDSLFERLFEHFREPGAWLVFPDVVPTLNQLREQGLRLAVISNFDSRLDEILTGLSLDQHFDAIHFSTRVGYAKPDPRIFQYALTHHDLRAEEVWHVGDSLRDDVGGALDAGISPIWLDRQGHDINNERLIRIQSLVEIPYLLSQE
ncbi:MAG: HAD-IA family hydrolase [Acidobacteriota bacterium]